MSRRATVYAGPLIAIAALGSAVPAFAAFECTTARSTTASPYAETKFRTVLDNTRSLQVKSTSTCLSTSELQDYRYDTDNWKLDGANMLFAFDGGSAGERAELRGFSFAGSLTNKTFVSTVKMATGGSYSAGFTVAQIFGENTGDPILRIEMIGNRNGFVNHLWAIYRTGTGSATVVYKDLGAAPSTFTDLVMGYNVSGTITAKLGTNATQTFSDNLSYWTQSNKLTYFKAGCYLQKAGSCRVTYSSLRFDK